MLASQNPRDASRVPSGQSDLALVRTQAALTYLTPDKQVIVYLKEEVLPEPVSVKPKTSALLEPYDLVKSKELSHKWFEIILKNNYRIEEHEGYISCTPLRCENVHFVVDSLTLRVNTVLCAIMWDFIPTVCDDGVKNLSSALIYSYALNNSDVLSKTYVLLFDEEMPKIKCEADSWSFSAMWEAIKNKTKSVKDVAVGYIQSLCSSTVMTTLGEWGGAVCERLGALIAGMVDPFNVFSKLYDKLCERYFKSDTLRQGWIRRLGSFAIGLASLLLAGFGIYSVKLLYNKWSLDATFEARDTDNYLWNFCCNALSKIVEWLFPSSLKLQAVELLSPMWNDLKELIFSRASIGFTILVFLIKFLPIGITRFYYKIFGDVKERAGIYLARLRTLYDEIIIRSEFPGAFTDPSFIQLVEEAFKMRTEIKETEFADQAYIEARNIFKELAKYRGRIGRNKLVGAARPIPMWIHVFGGWGVGKTTSREAIIAWAKERLVYENWHLEGVFSRNGDVVYNDGYCGQEIELVDEFGVCSESTTRSAIMSEMLAKCSSGSFMPNLASLEPGNPSGCKGTPYGGRLIYTTNNTPEFGNLDFKVRAGLLRRRTICVELTSAHPEYYDGQNNLLPEHIGKLGDPEALGFRYTVHIGRIADQQIHYDKSDPMSYSEFLEYIVSCWEYMQSINRQLGLVPIRVQTDEMVKSIIQAKPQSEHWEQVLELIQNPDFDRNDPIFTQYDPKVHYLMPKMKWAKNTSYFYGIGYEPMTGCLVDGDLIYYHKDLPFQMSKERDGECIYAVTEPGKLTYMDFPTYVSFKYIKHYVNVNKVYKDGEFVRITDAMAKAKSHGHMHPAITFGAVYCNAAWGSQGLANKFPRFFIGKRPLHFNDIPYLFDFDMDYIIHMIKIMDSELGNFRANTIFRYFQSRWYKISALLAIYHVIRDKDIKPSYLVSQTYPALGAWMNDKKSKGWSPATTGSWPSRDTPGDNSHDDYFSVSTYYSCSTIYKNEGATDFLQCYLPPRIGYGRDIVGLPAPEDVVRERMEQYQRAMDLGSNIQVARYLADTTCYYYDSKIVLYAADYQVGKKTLETHVHVDGYPVGVTKQEIVREGVFWVNGNSDFPAYNDLTVWYPEDKKESVWYEFLFLNGAKIKKDLLPTEHGTPQEIAPIKAEEVVDKPSPCSEIKPAEVPVSNSEDSVPTNPPTGGVADNDVAVDLVQPIPSVPVKKVADKTENDPSDGFESVNETDEVQIVNGRFALVDDGRIISGSKRQSRTLEYANRCLDYCDHDEAISDILREVPKPIKKPDPTPEMKEISDSCYNTWFTLGSLLSTGIGLYNAIVFFLGQETMVIPESPPHKQAEKGVKIDIDRYLAAVERDAKHVVDLIPKAAHESSEVNFMAVLHVGGCKFNAVYVGDSTFLTHSHTVKSMITGSLAVGLEYKTSYVEYSTTELQRAEGSVDLMLIRFKEYRNSLTPKAVNLLSLAKMGEHLERSPLNGTLYTKDVIPVENIVTCANVAYGSGINAKLAPYALSYRANTHNGDCGGALCIAAGTNICIGIHVAGADETDKDGNYMHTGFSIIVSSEVVESLRKCLQNNYRVAECENVIGTGQRPRDCPMIPQKIKTKRTMFTDKFQSDREPAILTTDDPRNPNHVLPQKYNRDILANKRQPYVDRNVLNRAVCDYLELIEEAVREYGPDRLTSLDIDFDTAVTGDDMLEAINTKVSGGYPIYLKPNERFTTGVDGRIHFTDLYRRVCYDYLQRLENGNETLYFVANNKDEAVRKSKIAEVRTRTVFEATQPSLIATKYRFARVLKFFNYIFKRELCHTINPASYDFHHAVYMYLTSHEGHKFVAGDYKAYDMHMVRAFQEEAYNIMFSISGVDEDLVEVYKEHLLHPKIIYPDGVFEFDCGHFSGNLFTAIINGIVNGLYMRYVWYSVSDLPFKEYVRCVFCGDDNVICFRDECCEYFNGHVIQRELEKLGLTYTSDTKDAPLKKWVGFSDISFAGSHPVMKQDGYVGCLTRDRIINALCWTTDPDNASWLQDILDFAYRAGESDIISLVIGIVMESDNKKFKCTVFKFHGEKSLRAQRMYRACTRKLPQFESETVSEIPPIEVVECGSDEGDVVNDDLGDQPPTIVLDAFLYKRTLTISTTDTAGTVVWKGDIYDVLASTDEDMQSQILKQYQYFSPNAKIQLQFNGQPLAQGLFEAMWVPLVTKDYIPPKDCLFQFENAIRFQANKSDNVVIDIPFKYFKEALNTKRVGLEAFGTFYLVVVSPLVYETGTTMNITMQVSLKDTKFQIPIPRIAEAENEGDAVMMMYNRRQRRDPRRAGYQQLDTKRVSYKKGRKWYNIRVPKEPPAIPDKPLLLNKELAQANLGVTKKPVAKKSYRYPKYVKSWYKNVGDLSDEGFLLKAGLELAEIVATGNYSKAVSYAINTLAANVPIKVSELSGVKRKIGSLIKNGDTISILRDAYDMLAYQDKPVDHTLTKVFQARPPFAGENYADPTAVLDYNVDNFYQTIGLPLGTDDARFDNFFNRETIIGRVNWSSSTSANATLWRGVLDSVVTTNIPTEMSPQLAVLNDFIFFRCDWVFKIYVVRNNFQNGSLRFISAFGEMDSTKTGNYRGSSYNRLINVCDDFICEEVIVPYTNVTPFIRTCRDYTSRSLTNSSCCGVVALEVANPLVLSNATVAENVEVLVTVSFRNIKLDCPRPFSPYPTTRYVIRAKPESLGPAEEADEQNGLVGIGAEDLPNHCMTDNTSFTQMNRRAMFIPLNMVQTTKYNYKYYTTVGNTTYYVVDYLIPLDYTMFYRASYFRAFAGSIEIRATNLPGTNVFATFYPFEESRGPFNQMVSGGYTSYGNLEGTEAIPQTLEVMWTQNFATVLAPFKSIYTFLNKASYNTYGWVQFRVQSTSAQPEPNFFICFGDDTRLGSYVPYMASLTNIGERAGIVTPPQ